MRIVLMKKITVENYRSDKYYPRVVGAVDSILARKDTVSPIEVFIEMGLLTGESVAAWRKGRLPFLERGIQCNISVASRILRLYRMHAHDLNLRPSNTAYVRKTYTGATPLRFTKTGDHKIEEAYARHFVRVVSKRKGPPPLSRDAATGSAPPDGLRYDGRDALAANVSSLFTTESAANPSDTVPAHRADPGG
jgi:hypothetical protein